MKVILFVVILVSALFSSDLGWSNDYDKALKDAKAQDKDIYMLITASDCRWCRKFENTTLQDKDMIDSLKSKYILIQVDRDFDDEIVEKYQAKRVPTHYFINSNEEVIYKFPGYWNSEDFRSFLQEVDKRRVDK